MDGCDMLLGFYVRILAAVQWHCKIGQTGAVETVNVSFKFRVLLRVFLGGRRQIWVMFLLCDWTERVGSAMVTQVFQLQWTYCLVLGVSVSTKQDFFGSQLLSCNYIIGIMKSMMITQTGL